MYTGAARSGTSKTWRLHSKAPARAWLHHRTVYFCTMRGKNLGQTGCYDPISRSDSVQIQGCGTWTGCSHRLWHQAEAWRISDRRVLGSSTCRTQAPPEELVRKLTIPSACTLVLLAMNKVGLDWEEPSLQASNLLPGSCPGYCDSDLYGPCAVLSSSAFANAQATTIAAYCRYT